MSRAARGAVPADSPVRSTPKIPPLVAATLARTRTDLNFAKEVADLARRGIGGIGTMNDVFIDAGGKIRADGSLVCLLWIRRPHHLAIFRDRIIPFEHLDHHGTGGHEANQILEERPLAMYRVKALGLGLGQPQHAGGDHLQTHLFKTTINLADQATADAVWLDD